MRLREPVPIIVLRPFYVNQGGIKKLNAMGNINLKLSGLFLEQVGIDHISSIVL